MNNKYLRYDKLKPGVTIFYNKNTNKNKNAKTKEGIGWIIRKDNRGWLATNISEDLFIINESNFLAWRESKRGVSA